MQYVVPRLVFASVGMMLLPGIALAQCEGGTAVAGYYLRDGTYVPGHCSVSNPTTPGPLYPSGAQPLPSTNPATGASRLPGQRAPAGPLPVASTDVGPDPSFVSRQLGQVGGLPRSGPSAGPGAAVMQANTGTAIGTGTNLTEPLNLAPLQPVAGPLYPGGPLPAAGTGLAVEVAELPAQLPPSGVPVMSGNRAVPSANSVTSPASVPGALPTTAALVAPATRVLPGGFGAGDPSGAYGYSLPPAPAPAEVESGPLPPGRGGPSYIGEEQGGGVIIAVPSQYVLLTRSQSAASARGLRDGRRPGSSR